MFWILTDGATLPTINERMFPRISQGQYVNGLGSVLPWLHDETTRKLAKNVLSLDTLLATTTNPDALDTLIQTWATEMPEEFDQFLATNREAIASLFMKEAPYLVQRYLIGLATSLLNSGRSEAGVVALECLLRTTRDHLIATERELNRRVLQEAYGKLMLLVLQVALGGNANAARLAFEVLAKHHYTEGSQEVQDVSERGPTLETDLDGDGKAELTDWSTIVIRFTDEERNLLPGGERYDTNRDGALTLDDLPPNHIAAHKAAKKAAEDLKVGA
ncbi:MAG: hypothetical protein KatS3mg015_1276 [Fimbriimonadales bacterium]|nr:MAG: hypothetical protein KatS3mg015_1276 [Fimbriimonadales bacterium]